MNYDSGRSFLELTKTSFRLESHMAVASESTKLESECTFVDYTGHDRLKGKKALITGGE